MAESKNKNTNTTPEEGQETTPQNNEGADASQSSEANAPEATDKPQTRGTRTVAQEKESGNRKVEVDAEVLEKLLNRVEKVEEDNKVLREAADQGRLSRIEQLRAAGKLVKSAKVNFLNNKAVVGWHKVKDDVYFDQEGRLHETQVVRVFYEGDDKGEELDYRFFARNMHKVEGEVISESKDKDGNINYTIQLDDGREFTLDVRFIN